MGCANREKIVVIKDYKLIFFWIFVFKNTLTGFVYKLRFILPCKSDCRPIFGIAQFVTGFTHVQRYFGALSREQTKKFIKNGFDNMVSNLHKNCINFL